MKLSVISLALLAALATGACNQTDTTDDYAATPDPAATDPMMDDAMAPAGDPMAPMSDPMAPTAGDAAMGADQDIVGGASASPDHTTLVAAIEAAELVDTLQGAGPFTVFAPTNAAFDALPDGTVDGLLEPDSQDALAEILTYHVVSGNVDAAALTSQIEAGGGSTVLTTVQGDELTAEASGGTVTLTDAQGNVATVTSTDMYQSNGVIHVIDTVLMPAD